MHKTHWNKTLSSALSFPFFKRKSGRIVSFLNNFKNGGSLAKFRRFGAVNFHFLRTSRRIASVLMLPTSKMEEVLPKFVALELWTFFFWRGLAELLRLWCCQLQKWRRSSKILSLWSCELSFFEDVSRNCFGFDVVNFKNGGSLAEVCRFGAVNCLLLKKSRRLASVFQKWRKPRRFLSLWSCELHFLKKSRKIASFQIERWMDGWMDGRTDGWMDGLMDGWDIERENEMEMEIVTGIKKGRDIATEKKKDTQLASDSQGNR